mmetsp:Transcript_134171/g.373942  ORF Transcript_134171/g.373942 Transcript_134171/m.373942 type:complete len:208 (-) Transcript_134171:799-1422(-)
MPASLAAQWLSTAPRAETGSGARQRRTSCGPAQGLRPDRSWDSLCRPPRTRLRTGRTPRARPACATYPGRPRGKQPRRCLRQFGRRRAQGRFCACSGRRPCSRQQGSTVQASSCTIRRLRQDPLPPHSAGIHASATPATRQTSGQAARKCAWQRLAAACAGRNHPSPSGPAMETASPWAPRCVQSGGPLRPGAVQSRGNSARAAPTR